MDEIVIREINDMEGFRALLELQRVIWGMSYGESTSPYILAVGRHNGGVVLGAEVNGELIGFCFGFPAPRGDQWLHWSHMTGVIPDYRGQGVGFKLKQAQRIWALKHGYTVMGWTFDPMQRGNANFNFRQLGTVSKTFIVNHYGEMTDQINAGLASDRLEVAWHLNDKRVLDLMNNPPTKTSEDHFEDIAFILRQNDDGELICAGDTVFNKDICYVEIPYRVNGLKRDNFELARDWQLELRWAMQQAFEQNYSVVDFVNQGGRGWYVLQKDK